MRIDIGSDYVLAFELDGGGFRISVLTRDGDDVKTVARSEILHVTSVEAKPNALGAQLTPDQSRLIALRVHSYSGHPENFHEFVSELAQSMGLNNNRVMRAYRRYPHKRYLSIAVEADSIDQSLTVSEQITHLASEFGVSRRTVNRALKACKVRLKFVDAGPAIEEYVKPEVVPEQQNPFWIFPEDEPVNATQVAKRKLGIAYDVRVRDISIKRVAELYSRAESTIKRILRDWPLEKLQAAVASNSRKP